MPWILIALVGVLFLAIMFLAPKPHTENARASTLDDLNFPVAKEGSPIPWIIGKIRHRGPNVIWYGDFEAQPIKKKMKTGLFSSQTVITGYKYFIGMDMGLCMGPNVTLTKIWCDKDVVWTGTANDETGTAININLPNLFGGISDTAGGGGGLIGTLRYYPGTFSQSVNAYMTSKVPGGVYNRVTGQAHIVAEHIYIGTAPNLRPFNFELSRYSNSLVLGGGMEKVGDDSNLAEAMYQVLTTQWGALGIDPSNINTDSFIAAATTLFNEGNGISIIISKSNGAKDVLGEMLRQADGVMYQDPGSGEITLSLVRNDYDVATLPIINPSNIISVKSFARTSWDNTMNQVRVGFTNRDNEYNTGMAMQQDMANINSQGRVRSADYSYPGISNGALAQYICSRELSKLCVPLFSIQVEVNRQAELLRPGQPFIFVWPEYGIESAVMRLQKYDMGELLDGKIVIHALQDVFAVSKTVFVEPSSSLWTSIPTQTADAVATRVLHESHYFFYQAAGIAGEINGTGSGILVCAPQPSSTSQYAEIDVSTDGGTTYADVQDQYPFTPVGTLQTVLTATANLGTGKIPTMKVAGLTAADLPVPAAGDRASGSGLFLIGDEYFLYEGVTDNGDGTFNLTNVWRGLLDSAPAAHAVNDKVCILSGDNVVREVYGGTAALKVKLLTASIDEQLDPTTAPVDNITLHNRVYRPSAPANIKFDGGTAFAGPADGAGTHVITWANRSRKSQSVRTLVDNTNEYEPGQQTVIRYQINGGAWTAATFAPGVVTASITTGATAGQTVAWEIYATRDNVDSWNRWEIGATAGGSSSTSATGTSQSTGGAAPADTTPTYSAPADSISLVFPFGATIGTDQIDLPITFDIDVPAAFVGSNVDHWVNPTADATFTVKKGATTVGTFKITTAGAYVFTAAAAFSLTNGDTLTCVPPAVADTTLKGVTITVAATRKQVG